MKRFYLTLLCILTCSCGGAAPQPTDEPLPTAEPVESVEMQSDDMSDTEVPAEEVIEAGPASITFTATVNRQPMTARIQLFRNGDELVAEANSGEKMTIQSGNYTAHIQAADTQVMVDQPIKTQDITLTKGADIDEQVTFPWAKVRLNVKVNGRLNKNAKIDLIKEGNVIATLRSAASQFVTISPGRYQAEVKAGSSVTKVDDVMFPEGATIDVPINVTF